MRTELKDALEREGWEALYEAYIPDLAAVNHRGERRGRSPFPYLIDREPSFSVNVVTGIWHCFKQKRGGDYIMFRALMEADQFDPVTGWGIADYAAMERKLLQEFGVVQRVDANQVTEWCARLRQDYSVQLGIQRSKPWSTSAMLSLGVGFDEERGRLTFPIFDRKGALVNVRMYRPDHGDYPKWIWYLSGVGGNFLWPHAAWAEQSLILVEGETDAMTLRAFGFPACSGTQGSDRPVPEGEWWYGKNVWVLMDDDPAGHEATTTAVKQLRERATTLHVVRLPDWPGKPAKADVSDWFMHLLSQGYAHEQVQRAFTELLCSAEAIPTGTEALNMDAVPVTFADALSGEWINRRVTLLARVAAKSPSRLMLPTRIAITCPAGTYPYCKKCPMHTQFSGFAQINHDPRSADSLSLVQVTQDQQLAAIKKITGIYKPCHDQRIKIEAAVNLEPVMLMSSTLEDAEGVADRQRREAYVIVKAGEAMEEQHDYTLEAFTLPHPKTQAGVLLVDRFTRHESALTRFDATREEAEELRALAVPVGTHPSAWLMQRVTDLETGWTMIRGRADLHLAYMMVWHSALAFPFLGRTVERGWLEALVVGDTRCGKSKTFSRMAEFLGVGTLIDCKLQTIPGILGSVQQSATGEYYIVPGLLPQQDGGVVCFDEFNARRHGGTLIEAMSSTRAEGVVRIHKAAQGEFKARVRSVWLANPGEGELIHELPDSGIEIMQRIIPQPEDIARFDLGLTVSQQEVDPSLLNLATHPEPLRFEQYLCRRLLSWAYSRPSDAIHFTPEAERAVLDMAMALSKRYDANIPLVEPNDQKTRVARLAVAVAAACFSTCVDLHHIIVTPEHVETCGWLYQVWYDKPSMGYLQYSQAAHRDRSIRDLADVAQIFNEVVAPHGRRLAEILLRTDWVDPRMFHQLIPTNSLWSSNVVGRLSSNNCLRLVERGRRSSFQKTPAFTAWLKAYLTSTPNG